MSESKHNDTINALKRLERAGDENSETNAKLVAAAKTLLGTINAETCKWITGFIPGDQDVLMPMDVAVAHGLDSLCQPVGIALPVAYTAGTSTGSLLQIITPRIDRRAALMLGEAVASGLMDSLAEWGESRVQAALSATSVMSKASK